jgi:hypothetical protein
VAKRLVQGELAAFDGQRALFVADGAESAAVRTGLLAGKALGLLLQEGGEGALGQAPSGGSGDLLQGLEVDVQARAGVAEEATGHDFSPAGGQFVDFLEFLRREGVLRHG